MIRFFQFIGNNKEIEDCFVDLKNKGNVSFVSKDSAFSNKILSLFFWVIFSARVNRHVRFPFKSFLFSRLVRRLSFENDDQVVFVFPQGWFDLDIIECLEKKYPSIITVMYCNDTIGYYCEEIPKMIPDKLGEQYDVVLCYNPEDARKYGYISASAYFSKLDGFDCKIDVLSDIVFVGQGKDRVKKLKEIDKYLGDSCKKDFVVVGQEKNVDGDIIYTNTYMSYRDYLKKECSSNCLLEILKGDTQGCTWRCWEAVYYNKKLLTNWKGIFDFQFYNPKYMKYFEKPEDIDINFVKERIPVEYGYNNENSPVAMLKLIESLMLRPHK